MEESVEMLLDNSSEDYQKAAQILLKCTSNILREPSNAKYRRIRIAKIQDQLLPISGAIECLFSIGFEEDGEFFTLPMSVPLDNLKKLHSTLAEKCHVSQPVVPACHSYVQSSSKTESVSRTSAAILQSEATFYNQLLAHIQTVRNYMKPAVLNKARAYMPLTQLTRTAEENFQRLNPVWGSVSDQLLLQLLSWFKESFFHWMNSPSCSACNGPTESCGHVQPSREEMAHQAHRVENYRCVSAQCGSYTRFPRYNDPLRLMETRVGRCGEWANCFTLCCLAAGLEARFVVDWTDHVWTEVYSTALGRWLHADPCENACDKPLLYEAGWGKKLSYVIAFSPDGIQDVTWRYTNHADEVLGRRTMCREGWLVHVLVALRQQIEDQCIREGHLTVPRKAMLATRTILELVELMASNTASTEGLGGRTTGSLEWREARGELGKLNFTPHVIIPTLEEISQLFIELKYTCGEDKYIRTTPNSTVIAGWQNLAFEVKDVFRKVESDWKMAYLARCEGTGVGSLIWKFDFGSSGVCIDKLEIKVQDKCFENGRTRWTLCGNDICSSVNSSDNLKTVESLTGCTNFTLTAQLFDGTGQHAWQHAQLFRQALSDSTFPLHIKIHLRRNC